MMNGRHQFNMYKLKHILSFRPFSDFFQMDTTLEIAPDAVSKVIVKQVDFNHALEFDIKPVRDLRTYS